MDDETKKWLTFDHSPEERESLLKQVAENEAKNAYNYTISVGSAYYEIENGIDEGFRTIRQRCQELIVLEIF